MSRRRSHMFYIAANLLLVGVQGALLAWKHHEGEALDFRSLLFCDALPVLTVVAVRGADQAQTRRELRTRTVVGTFTFMIAATLLAVKACGDIRRGL